MAEETKGDEEVENRKQEDVTLEILGGFLSFDVSFLLLIGVLQRLPSGHSVRASHAAALARRWRAEKERRREREMRRENGR